jgi:hypothetical protein
MEVIFISWDIVYPKLIKKYKRKVALWRADEEALLCNFLTVIQYATDSI